MRSTASDSARAHLLDVAEEILASHGFQALTIRELTQAAGVNLATVNYVFGTKDGLLIGLQQRMFGPMIQERLDRFDALEAAGNPTVRDIVRALIEPLGRMRDRHGTPAVELFRYLVAHSADRVRSASWELLEPGSRRFQALIVQALPEQPQAPLIERVHLVCQIAVPAALRALDVFDLGADVHDLESLIDFITAGLESSTRST